uniref:Chemokine interleukin-8-like domain-containing protein n=1 Tax=Cyprinus carpio TaxID=7962 RepID=A0A8C1QBH7_CYPCA
MKTKCIAFVATGDIKCGNMVKLKTFVLFLHISAPIALEAAQSTCCGELSNVKVPLKLVTSYYRTSSSCPRCAIVFKTIKGREFCVDPETPWVKSHVAKVDKRTTTATKAQTKSLTV